MIQGNYGAMWYSDGSDFYLLLTNSGDQNGSFNGLRPFRVNLAGGGMFTGALSASSYSGYAPPTGAAPAANQMISSDANGYVNFGWINTASGDNGTAAIARIYASNDSYIRYYTPANFRSVIGVGISQYFNNTGVRALNTTYQNTTGKPVFVSVVAVINPNNYMQLRTDGANPPGLVYNAVTNSNTTGTTATLSVCGWVMPNNFYMVFVSSGSMTNWLENN
jgi:hypothetical protein